MRQILRVGLAALAAALLLPISAYAQTGQVNGVIRDASGGALPGVLVEVTSPALIEKVRSTTSDPNGRYQMTALPVGTYTVTFALEGFTTFKRENIVITSDFTATINADMKVGSRSETVNVVAEAPVVDVQNARVQHVFQGTEIAELPTQHDIPSIMNLIPSLQTSALRGVCSGGVGAFCNPTVPLFNSHTSALDSVDGAQSGQNQGRIMVDGMSINMGRAGTGINENVGQANGLVLDTANAQEVTFTLSGSLGESETGGASINVVPRTGGNRYSGNYYTSYTGTKFFDRNRGTRLQNEPTNAFNYDYDMTGAFGGPVVKDRLWFYLQARMQNRNWFPGGGGQPGFTNLNEGLWGANYVPQRVCNAPRSCADNGALTYTNEYKNASVRFTAQATQKNKFNIYWDEQDSCTNPCYGMISIINSPEAYFTLMSRPNRLNQLSWTNPFTNRILFEAALSYQSTHQDQTKSREFTNPRHLPRICESGTTVGRDEFAILVNTQVSQAIGGSGSCNIFGTMNSGSLNDSLAATMTVVNDDTYRTRASASYITGSHNAKIGWDGAYFSEKVRNEVNDLRMNYHYQTPATTGTWNATTRSGNCLAAPATEIYACGNMNLYYANEDPTNKFYLRPRPVGFQMNTGVGITDERVWFGGFYVQDQWTLNRFTLNGALRFDHAESRYGATCIGPDINVPTAAIVVNGVEVSPAQPSGQWCSTPEKGVRYNDITPRWGVAWDVFGNGKTSVKWNMGKYLGSAGFGGLYTGFNDARRSTNTLTRGWDDLNGDRVIQCDIFNPAPHTATNGDFCGTLLGANGVPQDAYLTYGRPPNSTQLVNSNSTCGLKNSTLLHQEYCALADQNLMQGWGVRRGEWQFGLGVQHELLPRLSLEVTYNWRKYFNNTDNDTVLQGCDQFHVAASAGTISAQDTSVCTTGFLNYTDPSGLRDFYALQVPVDPRLPSGGGYYIRGLNNNHELGGLPGGGGSVATNNDALDYSWNGVDVNFVMRARGGLRISGGTSTGRSLRYTCNVDYDAPNVKGRDGSAGGGGCNIWRPFQTNVRANAAYTIPYIDVLVGTVFQYRPGTERSATLTYSNSDIVWEPGDQDRSGTQFNGNTTTSSTASVNMLDFGDLYGEGMRLWDLNFSKNIRFNRKRVNFGVNIYNMFNSDAATGYQDNYTAFRQPDNTWVQDNPSTATVESNTWGRVTGVTQPRFMRFTVSFDF